MDIQMMNNQIAIFLDNCRILAQKKNADYHPDRVAMLEILETAFESHITVEQDLWGRIRKQQSALRRYLFDGVVESEHPTGRMMDIVNYMAILNFWVNNRQRCVSDVLGFMTHRRKCERIVAGETTDCFAKHGMADVPCDRCAFVNWLHILATTGKYGQSRC